MSGGSANATGKMNAVKVWTEKKVKGAHYTPEGLAHFVAQRIVRVSDCQSLDEVRVLDPACGDGVLLAAIAKALPQRVLGRARLIGIESDDIALAKASERLRNVDSKEVELAKADFLDLCSALRKQGELFERFPLPKLLTRPADIIIANPPYVRTQILGARKAQALASTFGLSGRVDLYHAFLVAMTRCLASNGILGAITSNRFLTTRGGTSVREFLTREYDVLEVFDLGDTKLFEAAVLPAVFVGRRHGEKKVGNGKPKFVRVYEESNGNENFDRRESSIYPVLENGNDGVYMISGKRFRVSSGVLALPMSAREPWCMVTSREKKWVDQINRKAAQRVGDIAKVRVGIKTTADDVFIRSDWHELPRAIQPEKDVLRCLLSHHNMNRWVHEDRDKYSQVLYTHEIKGGRRSAISLPDHPKAAAYLKKHRIRLQGRKYVLEANRNWYEIWVPQDPQAWNQPKAVFPDISHEPKFLFDGDGCLVNGDCYWITINPPHHLDLLYLILGLANTNLMTRYHDLVFNNKLYSGRRRYLTQYVERYPLPELSDPFAQRIIESVKAFISSFHCCQSREKEEKELEILAGKVFGVEPILEL